MKINSANWWLIVSVLLVGRQEGSGCSTLGPGGHSPPPKSYPAPQKKFGHSSSATGWINLFYSKFRLAVIASQIMRGQAPQIFFLEPPLQEGHPAGKKYCHNSVPGSPWQCLQHAVIVTGGMLPWSRKAKQPRQPLQCSRVLTYLGSVIPAGCPQSRTLSSFGALTLLVSWQERHPACKSSATTIPRSLLLRTGLTWSNITGNNCGKMGRLNKNQERESMQ